MKYESEMLGKYVNHSTDFPNAKAKLIDGHICLFAIKDLMIGEELRYDYGVYNLWPVIEINIFRIKKLKCDISRENKATLTSGNFIF